MTARDGLSFRVFIESPDLRSALLAKGFSDLPKSAVTIQRLVMGHADLLRERTASELALRKANGKRFSLTFDEWTSTRNRRYMNVNVHAGADYWNLGLVRVHGSMPATKCVELLKSKLSVFALDLDRDIVAICTDGASVMVKVGKLIAAEQQLCFAHGIHLAVHNLLYKQHSQPQVTSSSDHNETANDYLNDSDEDDAADDDALDIMTEAGNLELDFTAELSDDYRQLIDRVRAVVKTFRRSPTKNDVILQKYVIDEFKEELSLILDCKTRWNSLVDMLARFLKLKNPIQKALIDVKTSVQLSDADFNNIEEIVMALEPIKLAVEALCR